MARGRSLTEFQKEFPDEASCAAFLFKRRWPDGFVCPSCGGDRAAALMSRAYTLRVLWLPDVDHGGHGDASHAACADGMVLGRAFDGDAFQRHVGARQLEDQLGLTYRTAWLLAQKLRRSMVDPDRELLEGVVEIDQAEIPFREGDTFFEPGNAGKILVIGAVEVIERDTHQRRVVGDHREADAARTGVEIFRVFASRFGLAASIEAFVRARGLGTYHGLRRKHADTYLNEFVFRYLPSRFVRNSARPYRATRADELLGHHRPRQPAKGKRYAPQGAAKTATGMRCIGGTAAKIRPLSCPRH